MKVMHKPMDRRSKDHFRPVGSNIWFKLYGPPSDPDVDLIGTVIQSWYLMGRLGAYNSSNLQWPFILQLANTSMEYNPLYDADKGFNVMPSSFHDVGDVEFQDNWGRVWVDIVFGGQSMGDWEEGMKNPEDGYKVLPYQLRKKDSSMEIRNEKSSSICSGGVVVNKRMGTVELKCVDVISKISPLDDLISRVNSSRKGKLDLIILENASSMCTLSNRSVEMGHHEFPKYQSKHQDQDIPQTHKDDGDMELCGHKTTQVLVGNSKDAAKIVRRRCLRGGVIAACLINFRVVVVVVCGSVSFSSSAELALGSYTCA
ncbi:hypothetical protein Tco_0475273 [Tanacetum coccineum]